MHLIRGRSLSALILFYMIDILLKERSPKLLVIMSDKYMRKAEETLRKVPCSLFSCSSEIYKSGDSRCPNLANSPRISE